MNILIAIGRDIEVDAKDLANFLGGAITDVERIANPQALLAFAVLMSAVGPVVMDATAAAAQDGLNFALDAETAQLIIQFWPLLDAWAKTLAIKPVPPKEATS